MNYLDKFIHYPEYEYYSQLFNRLDSSSSPEIVIVHQSSHPINETGKKLGIFSGSFNPITVAHTKMFDEAHKQFELDEILLLLAKANVDKEIYGLPLEGRILTLKSYAEEGNGVSIGISSHGRYIDKVSALKMVFPDDTEFHFIVGYDTLVRIFDAKYYVDMNAELKDLFSQCRFIVANRENVSIEKIKVYLDQPALQLYRPFISYLILPDFYAKISSTDVRDRFERGETISHLVPSVVKHYLD